MLQPQNNLSTAADGKNKFIEKLPNNFGEIVGILLQKGHLTRKQIEYAARVQSKIHTSKTMLEVIKELDYATDEQIRKTIRENLADVRIGDLLVELGLIGHSDLEAGLNLQAEEKPKKKLGEILINHHFIDEHKLIEVLSLQLGFPFVEPAFTEIDRELFSKAPLKLYETHNFIPIRREGDKILVAFVDPLDHRDIEKADTLFNNRVLPAITTKKSLHEALKRLQSKSKIQRISTGGDGESIVEMVDSIILAAVQARNVSDIHLEPMQDRFRIRFRTDGVLIQYKDYPLEYIPGITSRIKIMCEADIAEKRRHQGGRLLFEHNSEVMDMRVSVYVTVHGEKIVMRLINRQAELLSIEDIGMFPRMIERFRLEALDCPSGVVIVTGPTGSGKTTTVYSCINYLNKPQTSIITAEEPVEYIIEGIAQCSINPKINLTFEETLRHIVRQDPDVIVIGEIRDSYSAEVAVQAALTGHKVLTTFHTEDSIGGLIRLLNMDIDAFLISSTVVCVLAQRLMRKVCSACAVPYRLAPSEILRLGCTPNDLHGAEFQKGRGCSQCRHTGYKGRVAAFEMLILNEAVRDGILERKTSHQIRQVSIASTGLVTLFENGIFKASQGITTVEEVLRCLPSLQKARPLSELRRLIGG
jgi:type IV pilus assembly protein PilB